jgi:lysophospholipase L1-like esterase
MKTRWRMILVAAAVAASLAADLPGVPSVPSVPTTPSVPTLSPPTPPSLPTLSATMPTLVTPPADQPIPRMNARSGKPDSGWMKRHDTLVAQAKKGGIDLYFEGDSITDFWTSNRRGNGKAVWEKEFSGWHPGNFGISGDRTEHVLWRMENGELDGVTPKAVVLMIGTNNSGDCTAPQIADGVTAIVKEFREKEPQAKILLLAIFPRGDMPRDNPPDKRRKTNEAANALIGKLDDGEHVKFLDIGSKFPDPTTPEFKGIFPDLLHPNAQGYQIWADAIKPTLTQWLGAPAATVPAEGK